MISLVKLYYPSIIIFSEVAACIIWTVVTGQTDHINLCLSKEISEVSCKANVKAEWSWLLPTTYTCLRFPKEAVNRTNYRTVCFWIVSVLHQTLTRGLDLASSLIKLSSEVMWYIFIRFLICSVRTKQCNNITNQNQKRYYRLMSQYYSGSVIINPPP